MECKVRSFAWKEEFSGARRTAAVCGLSTLRDSVPLLTLSKEDMLEDLLGMEDPIRGMGSNAGHAVLSMLIAFPPITCMLLGVLAEVPLVK
jgi:hypothetical protein